jgi:hypothetical protein
MKKRNQRSGGAAKKCESFPYQPRTWFGIESAPNISVVSQIRPEKLECLHRSTFLKEWSQLQVFHIDFKMLADALCFLQLY